jgi:serine phosphatase RsbU (regulator of sigma subunit)/putative methionine-R-sulfoxide reductase with GAF domain/anti-sigma regulatory factor (Ser/Thr protein kinase)
MPFQTFPARFEYLDAIREMVAEAARQARMSEKDVYNVQLAVDEAASNIIEHAYESIPDGNLSVSVEIERDALTIVLHDWGKPFDPDEVAVPDVAADLEDRQIGGLGLFFIRKLMDSVQFQASPENGNRLTLVKKLEQPAAPAPQAKPGWRDLFGLGESILAAATFAEQRDLIFQTASRLFPDAAVGLWLDQAVFRLPDWVEDIFPPEPPSGLMRQALEIDEPIYKQVEDSFSAAVPLQHEKRDIGVIEVRRPPGVKFRQRERDLLEGMARAVSVALVAWHRVTVERWRIGQLGLVRSVSAQIAAEPNLDELARKVTRLIQAKFRYYYVAIFSLEKGDSLKFRASAGGATRRRGRPSSPKLEVQLGQGLIGHVALTGEEKLANDVRQEPLFRPSDSLPETRSEFVLPLKVEDSVVGVLDIQSDQAASFHPYDLLVLRALADTIAVAVEGSRLYSDLQRRAEQLRVVGEVSKQITSFLDLREMMREVAAIIQQKFEYPYVHLFTVHPNRRQIHYQAGSGALSDALEGYVVSLDDPEGLVPWVARNGETVLANDVTCEPRYRPSPLPPANTCSEIVVPLIFGGQVYGILDVQSDRLGAFSEDDKLLFETLADSIAAAIRNADLYRSEQWRRQVADSLREVAVLLSANASLEHVLDSILTELERNLPSDIAAIWLLDEDDLYCAAVHGAQLAELENARAASPEVSTALARALLARQPIIRKAGEPMGPSGVAGGFPDEYSSIAAPLRVGDQSVGILTLAHHTPGRYGHEAYAISTTFASYAAVAIENARLYDSAQEQAYASAALLQVAEAVVSLSDVDEIMGTIVRILPILVGVERAAIYTLDDETGLLMPRESYNIPAQAASLVWRPLLPEDFPLLDSALQRGEPVLNDDAELGPTAWLALSPCDERDAEQLLFSEDRLLMSIPLMLKGLVYGAMLVEEAQGGRRFRARRIEILTGVVQQVALAIQNDLYQQETVARERLETEVQLARQIQQTFIPEKLPERPHWELAARWRTARQVGGDFYDVFELPNQRVGLFIADVADKGVPAALFMALTRTLVRAAVLETESSAEALRRVNDLLYPDCQQGMFVTAVYAVIDEVKGTLTYANAGHNPPLWVSRHKVERLTRTGMALGVMENAEMQECVVQLRKGDSILFYTDGVTEAFSENGEIFGEERLSASLSSGKIPSAMAVLDAVDTSLINFVGEASPSDDITMIAVRRC